MKGGGDSSLSPQERSQVAHRQAAATLFLSNLDFHSPAKQSKLHSLDSCNAIQSSTSNPSVSSPSPNLPSDSSTMDKLDMNMNSFSPKSCLPSIAFPTPIHSIESTSCSSKGRSNWLKSVRSDGRPLFFLSLVKTNAYLLISYFYSVQFLNLE